MLSAIGNREIFFTLSIIDDGTIKNFSKDNIKNQ